MTRSDVCVKRKRKGFVWGFFRLFFICLIVFALSGCEGNVFESVSDDDSYEARTEEAMIALDDEDYSRARSLLAALLADYPNDPTILRYLSNAYAGLAGLDTFSLLETIANLNDLGEENEGAIDMIGLVLGDADGTITETEVTDDIDKLNSAITNMLDIETARGSLNDDETIQLGLLSLTRATLTIADAIMEERGVDSVELTEDGIAGLYEDSDPDANFSDAKYGDRLTAISADIVRVGEAIDAIAGLSDSGNDLSESFADFKEDVGGADDDISDEDLQDYVNSL